MTSNLSVRYDKHRYVYIDPLKRQPYGKSGVGYITKEIIDRNKNIDLYYLRDIPGDNKGRRMLERMLYGLDKGLKRKKPTEHIHKKRKINKSPSYSQTSSPTSSVSSNDSIDKIIKKLSGKKLIFSDEEEPLSKFVLTDLQPIKYFKDLEIDPYKFLGVKEKCSNKELEDSYINKQLFSGDKNKKYLELLDKCYSFIKNDINKSEKNSKLTDKKMLREYINKPLTDYEKKSIDKYIKTPLSESEKQRIKKLINQ